MSGVAGEEEAMLQVTERALEAIAQSLDVNAAEQEQALRLALTETGQLGLALDNPREGDEVVTKGERPVLLLEPEVSEQVDGAGLDVTEVPGGARLTVRMPGESPDGY
jgi:Fe-S cluster assembly iron-binding protein IscA